MKLTKKLETEILKVYNTYWESYSNGDIKTFAGMLDKTFELIGTSESEICHTKEDGIKFLKAQVKELGGKVEMRNRKISLVPVNELMLVNERCNIYFLTGQDWRFYSKIRISTFFRKTSSGWKVFHQHGSFPDMQVQEGETLAVKKINKENLQLRDAIKRRTIELEEMNRELEIETALEKVRTVAMGMKRREDMLQICKTISQQLAKLGVKEIRNVQTAIFNVPQGTYMNYEYYAKHNKTFVTETVYTNHKIARAFAAKMLKGRGQVSITYIKGKQKVKEWLNYQKRTNVFIDTYLNTATSLTYYWYSLGPVALGISTYTPLTKDEQLLFSRFLKVFELAYRRYLDIEKAEAQAREAQIEASLEKVRAQALGMRKPEELTNICEVLFKELKHLGFTELRNSMINIHDDEMKTFVNYDYSDEIGKSITPLYYDIHPVIKKQIKQIRSAVDAFSETVFKGRDLASWKAFRKSRGEKEDKRIKNSTALYYYFYSIGTGSIGISTFDAINEEERELLKRFRNVFAFAYRRYMDVATAEAQAREAQIEAALERVRAASMSMRDSSVLSEIIYKVYVELTKLDAKLDRCFIMIVHPESKGITWWMAGQEGLLANNGFFVQMNQHASHLMYLDNCKKRKKKWTYLFEGKEKRDWDHFGFSKTELARLPGPVKAFMSAAKKVYLSGSSDQFGSLVTGSFEPLPEEQQDIISRFAVVFNQTYTRFLDLQKAEEQAREAQIETALEKIRSRSLAMHKSDELKEVVAVLYQKLQELEFDMDKGAALVMTFSPDSNDHTQWITDATQTYAVPFFIPFTEYSISLDQINARGKNLPFYSKRYNQKEKNEYFRYLFKHTQYSQIPEPVQQMILDSQHFGISIAFEKNSAIAIPSTIGKLVTGEEINILKRFSKVFEQSYTRFLDLQKAESQAREAQIEAALERVRSRSLAMHKSEELKEVIRMVLEQFIQLNIKAEHAGFYIDYKVHDDMHIWLADPNLEPFYAVIPYFDTPTWNSFLEAKTKARLFGGQGITLHTDLLDFKTKNKFYRSLFKLFAIPEEAKKFYLQCKGLAVSTVLLDSVGLYIENFDGTPYTDEENNILIRFGKVFQQAYTRFLDLQKAEEQAKESQIQLALERVRARTMAMQKSEELPGAANLLFQQLQALGMPAWSAGYCIWNDDKSAVTLWMSSEGVLQPPFNAPTTEDELFIEMRKGHEKGKALHVVEMGGKKLEAHYKYMRTLPVVGEIFDSILEAGHPLPAFQVMHYAYFSRGYLLFITYEQVPESHDIFKRFANVFDQTYTRFLDLQKAEAQAREAEIQLALERVRAKSLAMHHTSELQEVVNIAAQQLHGIGMDINGGVFIVINTEIDKELSIWASGGMADYIQKIIVPELNKPIFTTLRDAIKKGNSFLIETFSDKEKQEMFTHLFKYEPWKSLPKERKKELLSRKGGFARSVVISHYTSISVTNHNGKSFTEQENEILKRFGKVFEQSYIRFLDLQKAEAQAREAKIEAALEKVRSRTMAMQKSEELPETSFILFQQMKELGEPAEQLTIGVVHEENNVIEISATVHGDMLKKIYLHSLDEPFMMRKVYNAWKNQQKSLVIEMKGDELNAYNKYRNELTKSEMFPTNLGGDQRRIVYAAFFSKGMLALAANDPRPQSLELLERFASVFDLTYTRFLDLKKAEAQAREAQIEAALEKVRSRTMAMQNSNELQETAAVLFQEFKKLGTEEIYQVTIGIYDEEENLIDFRVTDWAGSGQQEQRTFRLDMNEPSLLQPAIAAWKEGKKSAVFDLTGERLQGWLDYRNKISGITMRSQDTSGRRVISVAYFSKGHLSLSSPLPLAEETIKTLERFANVFDGTYTRFLDLEKAEAQAKEARIEAALERIRSKSLAMHHSSELSTVVDTLLQEFTKLEFSLTFCIINLINGDDLSNTVWAANPETGKDAESYYMKFEDYDFHRAMWNAWKAQDKRFVYTLEGEEKRIYDEYLYSQTEFRRFPKHVQDANKALERYVAGFTFFKYSGLQTVSVNEITEAELEILERFGRVFEQAYTRFLDLQKAEAQARETQIQLALERARAQSMMMQHSKELDDTLRVFHEQVLQLGIRSAFSFLWLPDEENDRHIFWAIWAENLPAGQAGNSTVFKSKAINYPLDRNEPATAQCLVDWKSKQVVSYQVHPEGVETYFGAWSELIEGAEHLKPEYFKEGLYYVEAFIKYGCFGVLVKDDLAEDEKKTLYRFAVEFERTYTRFLDLQKAEAQAREAQIEAALERVRSKTMSMHNSQDVGATVTSMFEELVKLGVPKTVRCGIGILKDATELELWTAYWGEGDNISLVLGRIDTSTHPLLSGAANAWRNNESTFCYELQGDDLINYYKVLNDAPDYDFHVDVSSLPEKLIHNSFYFPDGTVFAFAREPLTVELKQIFKRFAAVFGQTYRRYLDLLKAEANTREAQIEAALEKVRSRTLAMQKSDELSGTAAVLFQQLIALGIAPNRLYIILTKENSTDMEAWVTDEDGSKVSMGFTGNYQKNPSLKKMYEGWLEQKKSLVIDMQGEELQQYFHYLHDELKVPFKGGLEQKRRIQYIAYFSHGLIGMASPDEQPAETLHLLERFAAVFNLTFTRFNDLKIAEAHAEQAEQDLIAIKEAKQKAEAALTELQSAQKQLIQSEKMASLGELTAGIAHEIQNPLNFVNNFSEVSKELLDEMKDAIEKGDTEDAKEIMYDVIQNLEKINHHGKRADGIVKGMLQHSRTSSGQKELTDINALCDEYLRLAYHGLRAKDKSFNAKFETHFDEAVGKLSVIPQDIGRVVLNLINNAFYAVSERKKLNEPGYEPAVSVSTSKEAASIAIKVKDNGTGIPQRVLDKIFQPFFTTKPTGQGTGLGLSLSYDIVTKGHGGELKVETKTGEGTTFIIQIPAI